MKVYSETKWECGQCGCVFDPTKRKFHTSTTLKPVRVIIFCPNAKCGSWMEICDILEV